MSDNDLIRRIKVTLRQRGLTQRDLANRLGKKEAEVSRWMSGRVGISEASLRKIEEVLELPRTSPKPIKIGLIGTGSIAARFAAEAAHVEGCYLSAAYNPDLDAARLFADRFGIEAVAATPEELLAQCDAVYIASPYKTHYDYALQALQASRHVLCETPFTLTRRQAADLYTLAQRKGLTLLVALKTAYCPSYRQTIEVARSGIIGEVVDINLSLTTLVPEKSERLRRVQTGKMAEGICFNLHPVMELLGTDFRHITYYARCQDDVETYCRALVVYPNAVATLQVGIGVKSEGSMVISGTKGYIYVPAPWWRTDYFEVRFEDQNQNRKFYYNWEGEGLRYETQEFLRSIRDSRLGSPSLTREQVMAMAKAVQQFNERKKYYIL